MTVNAISVLNFVIIIQCESIATICVEISVNWLLVSEYGLSSHS